MRAIKREINQFQTHIKPEIPIAVMECPIKAKAVEEIIKKIDETPKPKAVK